MKEAIVIVMIAYYVCMYVASNTLLISLSTIVLNSRDRPKKTMMPTIYTPLKNMLGYTFHEKNY